MAAQPGHLRAKLGIELMYFVFVRSIFTVLGPLGHLSWVGHSG